MACVLRCFGHQVSAPQVAPMPLTDKQISNAKPADKPYHLFDGGGLY
jgi:hypothetical protein